ncbi:hypothetical protein KSC_071510 [Ktedonobacter sp. SOSP1-52]|nr:hypothetical protein KSC_071510 [Ktedonobacter sp. SOSP1-52]
MNMIRKGQIDGREKANIIGQIAFISSLFGVAAQAEQLETFIFLVFLGAFLQQSPNSLPLQHLQWLFALQQPLNQAVLQKHGEEHEERSVITLSRRLDGDSKQFCDERCLSRAISFLDSLYLSFPEHVHDFIAT